MDDLDMADLYNRFSYHSPIGDQPKRYGDIRSEAGVLAGLVVKLCPPSRERSLAITKIEEAVFWANAAIARHGTGEPE